MYLFIGYLLFFVCLFRFNKSYTNVLAFYRMKANIQQKKSLICFLSRYDEFTSNYVTLTRTLEICYFL